MQNPRPPKARPNRIWELTKERKWTYAIVAERVRTIAKARGDLDRAKVHEVTINRLASGKAKLTQDWMTLLGEAYAVSPAEIISAPVSQNLRRVLVICALEASNWRETNERPIKDQFEIMIPNDSALQGVSLYAGEITGDDNNLRYSRGSIVVCSKLEQKPGEITDGKRYHVRLSRVDGMIEDSIKCLTLGPEGDYWLKPESNHPDHQAWIPLAGRDDLKVEIIGRVRGVFFRED